MEHLDAIAAAGAAREEKQKAKADAGNALVAEIEAAGGSGSLKKVSKMEQLMHKKKSHKAETALEHAQTRKAVAVLQHKEKFGRAMGKLKKMRAVRQKPTRS